MGQDLRTAAANAADFFAFAAEDARKNLWPLLQAAVLCVADNIVYALRWLWYILCLGGEKCQQLWCKLRNLRQPGAATEAERQESVQSSAPGVPVDNTDENTKDKDESELC